MTEDASTETDIKQDDQSVIKQDDQSVIKQDDQSVIKQDDQSAICSQHKWGISPWVSIWGNSLVSLQ